MRDIKFRGKRVDNGEWIYGYLVVNQKGVVFIYPKDILHIWLTPKQSANSPDF